MHFFTDSGWGTRQIRQSDKLQDKSGAPSAPGAPRLNSTAGWGTMPCCATYSSKALRHSWE
jgi:hypothetical protein